MACSSLQPLPSRMLRIPMESPGGCGVRQFVGGSAMCRQKATWEFGREKVIITLVEVKKEVKKGKSLYWLL